MSGKNELEAQQFKKERQKWSGGTADPIEETSLYAYISCITSLSSTGSKTGLLNFGFRLQELVS